MGFSYGRSRGVKNIDIKKPHNLIFSVSTKGRQRGLKYPKLGPRGFYNRPLSDFGGVNKPRAQKRGRRGIYQKSISSISSVSTKGRVRRGQVPQTLSTWFVHAPLPLATQILLNIFRPPVI